MQRIIKIFAIIDAILMSLLVIVLNVVSCFIFYLSYKIITEESILLGIIAFGASLVVLLLCIILNIRQVQYIKANFKKCESCGNKIHKNTSLGGGYVRFTCISCGKNKWEDGKN